MKIIPVQCINFLPGFVPVLGQFFEILFFANKPIFRYFSYLAPYFFSRCRNSFQSGQSFFPATGRLRLTCRGKNQEFHPDDRISFPGKILAIRVD